MQEMLTTLRGFEGRDGGDHRPAQSTGGESGAPCDLDTGPDCGNSYTPIPYIIPAQLFAAALALENNLHAERPRTLSKITRTL